MPGAVWFRGAQVNVAQQVMRHADASHAAGHPAIVFSDERLLAAGELRELSWPELRRQVAALAAQLQAMGVQRGDRVVAYLPNIPQTLVCLPRRGEHRRGLVGLLARHGAGGGARPLPADRAGGADRLRRLRLRRRAARPDRRWSPNCWRNCRACATWCCCPAWTRPPTCRPGPRRGAAAPLGRPAGGRAPRASRSGCRSTTRCGSSTRAAPRACPSRSCTATAASCSRC